MTQKIPINLVLTRYGRQLCLPIDRYVGASLDVYGEFSPEEGALLYKLVKGKNVIEVGANMGALTLPLAVSAAKVWAYEPQAFLAKLVSSLQLFNHLPNLIVINKAVGEKVETIFLPAMDYSVDNNYGGYGQEYWEQAKELPDIQMLEVPVTTLDEEFKTNLKEYLPIEFIKIDVEGMELDVLKGGAKLIDRYQPVLYIENDRNPKAPALVTWLHEAGYTCYWHCPPLFSENNFAKEPKNIFKGFISYNLLCLPKGGAWFQVDPQVPQATPDDPCTPEVKLG